MELNLKNFKDRLTLYCNKCVFKYQCIVINIQTFQKLGRQNFRLRNPVIGYTITLVASWRDNGAVQTFSARIRKISTSSGRRGCPRWRGRANPKKIKFTLQIPPNRIKPGQPFPPSRNFASVRTTHDIIQRVRSNVKQGFHSEWRSALWTRCPNFLRECSFILQLHPGLDEVK